MITPIVGHFYEFKNPENQTQTFGKALTVEGDIATFLVF